MKKREPVSEIMTKSVISVNKTTNNLRDVKNLFHNEKIRHLPVNDGEKIVGIISNNDLMRLSFGSVFDNQENADEAVLDMLSIDQVMTHNPTTVESSTPIREVAEMLIESGFHSLPIVDDNQTVGIVTSTDIMKYFLEQY
ncbi:MAG: CBS domain-containing protein [Bacteroidetes bacterium]|jgi:signal-transduction protein with cAMP-binding, CBS, and nucleotidyltransferase domain|nr:CBS domain-containing protein [Bacteroidota bacterium]